MKGFILGNYMGCGVIQINGGRIYYSYRDPKCTRSGGPLGINDCIEFIDSKSFKIVTKIEDDSSFVTTTDITDEVRKMCKEWLIYFSNQIDEDEEDYEIVNKINKRVWKYLSVKIDYKEIKFDFMKKLKKINLVECVLDSSESSEEEFESDGCHGEECDS